MYVQVEWLKLHTPGFNVYTSCEVLRPFLPMVQMAGASFLDNVQVERILLKAESSKVVVQPHSHVPDFWFCAVLAGLMEVMVL